MRTTWWIALAALVVAPAGVAGRQKSQQPAPQRAAASSASSPAKASNQQDSLAAAARRAREEHKHAPKAAKVFTNDNLPTQGGISTVGAASAAEGSPQAAAGSTASASKMGQKDWEKKFAKLRAKLQQDQDQLSVMQRELGQQRLQYYNGNPQQAAQDQASGQPFGQAYNKKRAAIEAKKKEIEADQQAISDAEDALHRAGGDPGWAR